MGKRLSIDDFNENTKTKLKGRVANRCSNPTCRVITSGPAGEDRVNNTGIAAHITAASPGGPRYNPHLTSAERSSFDNGIWLCLICASKIDRDVDLYPVEVLRDWKSKAEQKAFEENGSSLPSKQDVDNTIRSALTGFPLKMLPTSIANIHQANSSLLEELDPRFKIESSFSNGLTVYKLLPKENVPFSVNVKDGVHRENALAFQRLWEDGKDLSIDMGSIKISGSKLLEQICEESSINGKFKIASSKIKAVQKVWLVDRETKQVESFDDVHGEISSGTKSLTFKGNSCNGVMEFELKIKKPPEDNSMKIVLALNYENWDGLPVNSLPYFEKIHSLYAKMCEGWEFYTSLEVNGDQLLASTGMDMSGFEIVQNNGNFLNYTKYCRTICSKLSKSVNFVSKFSFNKEEIQDIFDVSEILLGNWVFSDPTQFNNTNRKIILTVDPSEILSVLSNDEPMQIGFEGDEHEIKLFKSSVTLPQLKITVDSVAPKILSNLEGLKSGDQIEVEWIPKENFKCTYEYLI